MSNKTINLVFYSTVGALTALFLTIGAISHSTPSPQPSTLVEAIEYQTATPTATPTPVPTVTPTLTPAPTPAAVSAASSAVSSVVALPAPLHGTGNWVRLSYAEARARWLNLLATYPWDADEALLVLLCESSGDPLVVSSAGCVGLFQICTSGDQSRLGDPATNVSLAYSKYLDGLARGNRWYHWNHFGTCGHFD